MTIAIVKVTSKQDAAGNWRFLHCDACGGSSTAIWLIEGKRHCIVCKNKREQGE